MKFLVDNQLPAALARFLYDRGIVSAHVLDLGLETARDREIWAYAKANGYIIVSKDDDFLQLATIDPEGPALIWVRLGNCRKAELLATFSEALPKVVEILQTGQKIIEMR